MKICRKCKIEYKDDYIYCPKCGIPYDEKMKPVKIPGDISGGMVSTFTKIWNGLLYGYGGLLILAYITSFKEDIISSIFAILFGLSLFKCLYKIIEDKFTQIDEKYIKIARVAIPFVILFAWMICVPVENSEVDNNSNQSNIEQNKNINNNENQSDLNEENDMDKVEEEPQQNIPQKQEVVYILKHDELGEYGKYVEYEKENEIFYYLPNGKYKVEAISMEDTVCFLWIDYREGYQNGNHGTAYNNEEKLTFTKSSKINSVTLDNSVHIYNSNKCDYKFTLID